MPEGHTIHRLAKDHTRDLRGHALTVQSPQGRFGDGAARLNGAVLHRIDPYGKHLFYRFGSARAAVATTLHIHLGLFGKFTRRASPPDAARETIRLRMTGPHWTVDLTGPTDCRIIEPDEEASIRRRLGPDPIRTDADPVVAWNRLSKRRSSIGEALMDQKVMAGVGNVFRAESLYVHGIHPSRPANQILRCEFDALWATLVAMLRQGVKDDAIITLADAELPRPRRTIKSKEAVYVYKRETCWRCMTVIDRWDLAGRWAYACPRCQPR